MSASDMLLASNIQTCSLILRPWNEASVILRPWNEASVILRPWNEASSNPELLSQESLYPRLWEISETKLLDWKLQCTCTHTQGRVCTRYWVVTVWFSLLYVGCSGPWNSNHEWSMDPKLLGTQRLTVRLYVISTSGNWCCTISTVAVCTLFHVVYQCLHSYSDISATGPDMVRCLYLHTVEPLQYGHPWDQNNCRDLWGVLILEENNTCT